MKTAKRTLSMVLVLMLLVGIFAMTASAHENTAATQVEINFYYNKQILADVEPIKEVLPLGMIDGLADWLNKRLDGIGYEEPLKIPEGYALKNDVWYWVSDNAVVTDEDVIAAAAGDEKICRVYINLIDEVPLSYAVRFNKNHASAKGIMDYQYVSIGRMTRLTSCAYTLAGYTFTGWNTMPDGSGLPFQNQQAIINLFGVGEAVDLYAQWEKGNTPAVPRSIYGTYKNAVEVKCSAAHHESASYSYDVTEASDIVMSPCGTKAYVYLSNKEISAYNYCYDNAGNADHSFVARIAPVITLKYYASPFWLLPGYWDVESAAEVPLSCDCVECCTMWHQHTVTYTDGVEDAEIFKDIQFTQKTGERTKIPEKPVRAGYTFTGWSPAVCRFVRGCVTYTATWVRNDTPTLTTAHVAYLKGYGGGIVKPEGNITRAEAVSILYRLMDAESTKAFYTNYNTFADVAKNAWYNDAVSTLANAGVLKNTTGLFNPNEAITRAEFFFMLTKFNDTVYYGECTFKDVPGNHWAYKELALAQYLGWIKGYGGKMAQPDETITRAEVAASLNRVLGRTGCAIKDTKNYTDNPATAWYYKDIIEASIAH